MVDKTISCFECVRNKPQEIRTYQLRACFVLLTLVCLPVQEIDLFLQMVKQSFLKLLFGSMKTPKNNFLIMTNIRFYVGSFWSPGFSPDYLHYPKASKEVRL